MELTKTEKDIINQVRKAEKNHVYQNFHLVIHGSPLGEGHLITCKKQKPLNTLGLPAVLHEAFTYLENYYNTRSQIFIVAFEDGIMSVLT